MPRFIVLFLLIVMTSPLTAQDENLRYEDYTYLSNIKSVKFHLQGLFLSYPIVDLNSNAQMLLSFDDLDGDVKDYVYTIVHCDRDWTPSGLSEMEYLDGFTDETIDNYNNSFNTRVFYTHYELGLPNENLTWTKSGNYLLKVYEDEDEKRLAITRRFMVVDNLLQIDPEAVGPNQVTKRNTHQEIDFKVYDKKSIVRTPRSEIKATVLQNGRWDSAIQDLEPMFVRGTEIDFDYQNKVIFPAGNEFRYVDLRSLVYLTENVKDIVVYEDGYDVTLLKDSKRIRQPYLSYLDANGQFTVEVRDKVQDLDLRADYADVLFTLESPAEMEGADVYLFGAITDWKLKEEYKLVYNDLVGSYVIKTPLKQGYINYAYAVLPKNSKTPEFHITEGDFYETENNYTILIYYRSLGTRYDQLISAYSFTVPQ